MKTKRSILSASATREAHPGKVKENTIVNDAGGAMLDLDTDLQTGFKTFHLTEVYISNENDNRLTNCKIAANSKFSVVFKGLGNFTRKDGKVHPKLSMILRGGHDNIMLEEHDLLSEDKDGFLPEDVTILRATVNVMEPITHGEYFLSITVTDNNNKDASIISTWSFNVN